MKSSTLYGVVQKRFPFVLKFIAIVALILMCHLAQAQVKNSIADSAFTAFDASFLRKTNGLTFYRTALNNNEKDYFWQQALDIQTPEDVYFRTNNPVVKSQINSLLTTFSVQNTTNWEWNEYNDDIFWAVLAYVRGYECTGNAIFLNQAKYGFNLAYSHTTNGGWGWDSSLGGGIWWSKKKEDKNALSNSPGVISACYLYKFTNDVNYLNIAKAIYAWERSHLLDVATGDVWSAIMADGTINKGLAIFNSGAFAGAANFLYQITGEKAYFDDAKLVLNRVISNNTWSGVLAASGRNGTEIAEYIRYLSDFARQNYLWNEYYSFMKRCADAAWSVRRRDLNLTWNDFTRQTPSDSITGVNECNSAVVIQQLTPILQGLPDTIEAENYNYMKGVVVQNNAAASGMKNVVDLATGDNLEYIVTIPNTGIYNISLNVAGLVDGSVVLEQNGKTLSTLNIPATGSLQTYSTVSASVQLTAGIQSIKFVGVVGSWNFDRWAASLVTAFLPGKIQAESYEKMVGITLESTKDVDGGENVNGIDTGDLMEYSVDIPTTGSYTISYRVSAQSTGAFIRLYENGKIVANTNIPRTGNYRNISTYQNWTTVTTKANLTAGARTLRLYALSGGWNINWMNIVPTDLAPTAVNTISSNTISIYPTPTTNFLTVDCGDLKNVRAVIYDNSGRSLTLRTEMKDGKSIIDVSELVRGVYFIELTTDKNERFVKKFIK